MLNKFNMLGVEKFAYERVIASIGAWELEYPMKIHDWDFGASLWEK